MNADDLLVDVQHWRMASLAIDRDRPPTMRAGPKSTTGVYPVCGTASRRRHSWYRCTAMDLPGRKSSVRLRVWARRFFCDESGCERKIFAERFATLLPLYGRRTEDV